MKIQSRQFDTARVLLAAVFAVMLVFNFLTPLAADDYLYSLNLADEGPLTGLADLAASLECNWRYSNGRTLAHFFAQVFLQLPKGVFNFLNAANSALLVWLIFRFSRSGEKRRDTLLLLTLIALLWLLMPAFGQAFLWLTGSCNYSWGLSLGLLFLFPYYAYFMEGAEPGPRGVPGGLAFCLLAFFAGGYSENGSLAVLAAAFCLAVLAFWRERRLPWHLAAGFLTACAGFAGLMLAPSELGKKNRGAGSGEPGLVSRVLEQLTGSGRGWLLLAGALAVLALLFLLCRRKRERFFPLCAVFSLLGTAALMLLLAPELNGSGPLRAVKLLLSDVKEGLLVLFGSYAALLLAALACRVDRRKLAAAAVLGLSAAGSVLVFVLAVYFPARGGCVAAVYITAADGLLLSGLWERGRSGCLRVLCVLSCALMLGSLVLGAAEIGDTWKQSRERIQALEQGRAEGAPYVSLEPILPELKYSALWENDFQKFSTHMAQLYGVNGVWINGVDYS